MSLSKLSRAQARVRGQGLLRDAKVRAARLSSRHEDADANDEFVKEHTPKGTHNPYKTYQVQWVQYVEERLRPSLPAAADLVMSFQRKLLKEGKSRSTVTKTVPSAIAALHREHGLDSPMWDPRFKLMKRMLIRASPPPKQKNPVTPLMLVQLAMRVQPDSFIEVRDMFLFMLLFKVMGRQSEANNLRCRDIDIVTVDGRQVLRTFFATHEPTKNDPERRGDCILVEESDNPLTCLVAWYRLYCQLRGNHRSEYVFVSSCASHDGGKVSRLGLALPNSRLKVRCAQAGIDGKRTQAALRALDRGRVGNTGNGDLVSRRHVHAFIVSDRRNCGRTKPPSMGSKSTSTGSPMRASSGGASSRLDSR